MPVQERQAVLHVLLAVILVAVALAAPPALLATIAPLIHVAGAPHVPLVPFKMPIPPLDAKAARLALTRAALLLLDA
jgi:hypothetical protein